MVKGKELDSTLSSKHTSRARNQGIPRLINSDQDEDRDLESPKSMADLQDNDGSSSDDDDGGGKGKSRRELPSGAVSTLKAWLLSPEHFTHPYPTPQDQIMLMQKTGIDKKQLKNWFTNARRRIWKPMLKKQLEQGKLTATGAGGGGVAVSGAVPGLLVTGMTGPHPTTDLTAPENPHSTQAMHVHYQQAVQQQQAQQVSPTRSYSASSFFVVDIRLFSFSTTSMAVLFTCKYRYQPWSRLQCNTINLNTVNSKCLQYQHRSLPTILLDHIPPW